MDKIPKITHICVTPQYQCQKPYKTIAQRHRHHMHTIHHSSFYIPTESQICWTKRIIWFLLREWFEGPHETISQKVLRVFFPFDCLSNIFFFTLLYPICKHRHLFFFFLCVSIRDTMKWPILNGSFIFSLYLVTYTENNS